MSGRIELWAHLPSNAYGSLEDAPGEIRKQRNRHVPTRRGLIEAIRRAQDLNDEYTATHGNAAARRVEVRLPNGRRFTDWAREGEEMDWSLLLALMGVDALPTRPDYQDRSEREARLRFAEQTACSVLAQA